MPFQSKAQMAKCFATGDPRWNCHDWAQETPNIAQLPEHKVKLNTSQGVKKMADGGVAGDGGAITLKAKIKVKAKGKAQMPKASELPGLLGAIGAPAKKRKVRFGKTN